MGNTLTTLLTEFNHLFKLSIKDISTAGPNVNSIFRVPTYCWDLNFREIYFNNRISIRLTFYMIDVSQSTIQSNEWIKQLAVVSKCTLVLFQLRITQFESGYCYNKWRRWQGHSYPAATCLLSIYRTSCPWLLPFLWGLFCIVSISTVVDQLSFTEINMWKWKSNIII